MGKPGHFYPNVPMAIDECTQGTRPPPLLPSAVATMLETKTFFARSDVATVAGLYRSFFHAVAPWQRELLLSGLGWSDEQAIKLVDALPGFGRLERLDLSANRVGAGGARELAGWLTGSASITQVLPN